MENIKEEFKDFLLKVVLSNKKGNSSWINKDNIDFRLNEIETKYESAFGKNPFTLDLSNREDTIQDFKANLKDKSETDFDEYNGKSGKGIPNAIINTHLINFINYFHREIEFNSFQKLVDNLHSTLEAIFCKKFQEQRIEYNGNSKIPSSSEIFGKVRDNYWTINKGSEREVQYHMFYDQESVGYGLAFNAQSSINNPNPLYEVSPFIESFSSNKNDIKNILNDYCYIVNDEQMLKNIKIGDFVCFGKKIKVKKINDETFSIPGLSFIEMVYDHKNKQFDAYKLIWENKITQKKKDISMMKNINLLLYKKQIILQGPPGTGKTREAKEIAKEMLGLSSNEELMNHEQFKLIQFHPSYTYEDFVRGIVAKLNEDDEGTIREGIIYVAENKTLGEFADRALRNYQNSKKTIEQISKEVWVQEIYIEFKAYLENQLNRLIELQEKSNDDLTEEEEEEISKIKEELKIKKGYIPKIIFIEDDSLRIIRYRDETKTFLIKDDDIIKGYIGLYLTNSPIEIKKNSTLSKSARSGMYYLYQNLVEKFKTFLADNNQEYKEPANNEKIDEKPFVLIIDEINRANLSSVLGELIYALEYRGEAVESIYSVDESILDNKKEIVLPPNLYIIGTMNTADRSVGHIDYAMRRRFAFVDVLPKELSENDKIYFNNEGYLKVSELFTPSNVSSEFKIDDVKIGHSYFIAKKEDATDESKRNEIFKIKMNYEVIPILLEYVKDGVLIGKVGDKDIESYIKSLKSE
jgi:MoxR-like ATPase